MDDERTSDMGIVPGFKHDLFVSYAHSDNEEDMQGVRWVSRFQLGLKNALHQRLGKDPEIFFDTRNFEASDHVDFLLENARQSAVFVAVLSPSYVERDFTIHELQTFCQNAPDRGAVVTVELLPLEEDRIHPLLRGRKRTPFWWKKKDEEDVAFSLTPKSNPDMFNERLHILAHQIKNLLVDPSGRSAPRAATNGRSQPAANSAAVASNAVLLAEATDDLYGERERVRAYLEQFGIKVLPESGYPQGGRDFAAALQADIERSGLFVQLLGNFGSRKPPDLPQTYARYQYEVAKARGLKVLQWRRPDLDLATVTHPDKSLLEGPTVSAVGLEEFKGEVLRYCNQTATAASACKPDHCHIFINADRSDKEFADSVLKLLEGKKNCTAARPLFEGSAKDIIDDLEANLVNCGALILLYGSAPAAWVRAQMLRCSKLEQFRDAPLHLKTIVVGPPAPKAELAWSGGFETVDCQDGNVTARIQTVLAGWRL